MTRCRPLRLHTHTRTHRGFWQTTLCVLICFGTVEAEDVNFDSRVLVRADVSDRTRTYTWVPFPEEATALLPQIPPIDVLQSYVPNLPTTSILGRAIGELQPGAFGPGIIGLHFTLSDAPVKLGAMSISTGRKWFHTGYMTWIRTDDLTWIRTGSMTWKPNSQAGAAKTLFESQYVDASFKVVGLSFWSTLKGKTLEGRIEEVKKKGTWKDFVREINADEFAQVGLVVARGELTLRQGQDTMVLKNVHLTLAGVYVPLREDVRSLTLGDIVLPEY